MSATQNVEIQASDVGFFSKNDEAAFFEWLDKIACVEKYFGRLRTINIIIKNDALDEDSLRELLALFNRYKIDMKPLIKLDRPEFAAWFHNQKAYWYQAIFAPAG